jgi:uncharacterized protein (DUF1501 family)
MTSRRVFLKQGACAFVTLGFAPSFLARTAMAAGAGRPKQLIAIFQRGAVDGLNVVVPFGEPEYYRARPTLAIARPGSADGSAADLDGFFGSIPACCRSSRCGTRGALPSCTRADRPTAHGRISTRRITWRPRRPA